MEKTAARRSEAKATKLGAKIAETAEKSDARKASANRMPGNKVTGEIGFSNQESSRNKDNAPEHKDCCSHKCFHISLCLCVCVCVY